MHLAQHDIHALLGHDNCPNFRERMIGGKFAACLSSHFLARRRTAAFSSGLLRIEPSLCGYRCREGACRHHANPRSSGQARTQAVCPQRAKRSDTRREQSRQRA